MNKDIFKFASSLSEEKLISHDIVIESLLASIKHALSIETGLSIEVKLENDTIKIFTVRVLKDKPIGLGEISKETIAAHLGEGIYEGLNQNNFAELKEGDFISEQIDSMPTFELTQLDRNTINSINKAFSALINKIEKNREYERFKSKKGEVVSGTVSQIQAGNFIIKLDGGEGFLSKNEIIPGEYFNFGDPVQVYIFDVKHDPVKYQIMLSRSRPEFIAGLMHSMFPEVQSGLIEIKRIARDEGNRCKIAVYSEQKHIDAAGSCIGRDGVRIKSIRALVANERIDIVHWDPDPAIFLEKALQPVEAKKFIFHSENQVEIVLNQENMLKAKAHRSQLIRLASILTKLRIIAISEEESERRAKEEYEQSLEMFSNLGLSELQTRILFGNEITSVEDLHYASAQEITNILSESEEFVNSLKEKAQVEYNKYIEGEYNKAGVDIILSKIPGMSVHPSIFTDYGVYNFEQFALLDSEEVASILKESGADYGDDEEQLSKMSEEIVLWAREQRST